MASRFVSGGTLEKPTERDSEWVQAQQELEDKRREREDEASKHQDGRTLYEVLQANKAAKQEAFEESIKLKNQFRALNDDEIDFLDSALESTRAKEDAIRKETSEQLERFRQRQEQVDKVAETPPDASKAPGEGENDREELVGDDTHWSISAKKRKRGKEREVLKGVKARRTSSINEDKLDAITSTPANEQKQETDKTKDSSKATSGQSASPVRIEAPTAKSGSGKDATPPKKGPLGLVGYGSDGDSD